MSIQTTCRNGFRKVVAIVAGLAFGVVNGTWATTTAYHQVMETQNDTAITAMYLDKHVAMRVIFR